MRENCKAVVARPTTVPIMSQSYVELHGLPNPSPCTVHKPRILSPSLSGTLSSSLSFSYDVALSAAYYYHYVFCDIWVPMLFDWHGLCVSVSVCVFLSWLAFWGLAGLKGPREQPQGCRQSALSSVSQSVRQNITQALSVKNATSDMWDIILELSKWRQCSLWNPVKCPSNTRNSWAPHAPHWCKCQEA